MSSVLPDNQDTRKPIHILSLDGGGVRGLSSLILLRELMTRLGVRKGLASPADLRPSDCFDLIVGTGTGGISALFLGRMGMTVEEAIVEYLRVANSAFNPCTSSAARQTSSSGGPRPELDGRELERTIGDVAKRFLGDRDAALEDSPSRNPRCRTAVLASASAHVDAPPHIFCSYTKSLPATQFAVHEVARATVAVTGLFSPISLGNPPVEYITAGLVGYNNPADMALHEATQIWPNSQFKVACLVSVGTGCQKLIQVGADWENLTNVSEKLAQDCERVHLALSRRLHFEEVPYFRFNVPRGLDVHVVEWSKSGSAGQMTGLTEGYTRDPDVIRSLDSCVKILNGESPVPAVSNIVKKDHTIGKFLPLHYPPPKIFYGRDKYVQDAVDLLIEKEGVHLTILGPGGIGKTSIARKILHDSRIKSKFQEHCYFVSCEGINSSILLVDTLCEVFALQNHSANRQNDLVGFIKHTYTIKSLLLILDNFETVWEPAPSAVEDILEALAYADGISLLLTMRGSERPAGLPWARLPVVTPFDQEASHRTFIEISNREDDGKLKLLLNKLDHIPLAVTLMAHLGQTESPTQLLRRWEKEQTKLLSRSEEQSRLKNVDISIEVSLESLRMKTCPKALILLSVVALLPDGVFEGNLPGICPNLSSFDMAAATLCQVGLAHYDNIQTLYVLSPIRSYVLERYPLKEPYLHDLQSFYFKLAALSRIEDSNDNYYSSRKTLQQAEANMEAILTKALIAPSNHEDDLKIKAALDWAYFLYMTTPRDDILLLALKLSKRDTKQPELQAQCLQSLGNIQYMQSNYLEAHDILSIARSEFEALGQPLGAAQCLQSLGHIQCMKSNYLKAWDILSTARSEFEALSERLGTAHCLQSLGDIQYMQSHYLEAQHLLSTARSEFEAFGQRLRAAQCLQYLGDIQRMQCNYLEAQDMLSTARSEFEALSQRSGATQCLLSLGNIQYMQSHYLEAQDMLSTARSEFEALGERLGAAQCLLSLGNIQYMQSHFLKAQEMLSTAKSEFDALGLRLGAVQCLRPLGDIQRMLSNYVEAYDILTTARSEFEALGVQLGAAQCLQSLGDIQHMQSNNLEAQKMLSTARSEFKALNERLGAAQCLRSLGNIQGMQSNYLVAQEMLSTARSEFEALGLHLGAAQCLRSLGDIQRMQCNYSEAQDILSTARLEFKALGMQLGAAQCLRSLGDIQLMQSNYSKAQDILSKARSEFQALDVGLGAAQCLQSLGDIQHMQSNDLEAQNMLSTARSEFEALDERLGVAQCLQSLGDIRYMQSKYSEAQDMFSKARSEFEAIGNHHEAAQCISKLNAIRNKDCEHTINDFI